MKAGDTLVVEARDLDALLGALRERGHTLLGPTVRDGAIVIGEELGGFVRDTQRVLEVAAFHGFPDDDLDAFIEWHTASLSISY